MYIERKIEFDPTITLKELKLGLRTDIGTDLSIESIRKIILRLKITLKRTGLVLNRVNDPERICLRKEFATEFLTLAPIDDRRNVFVDESGFNLHMRRNYGRNYVGRRVAVRVPTVRGRNITLLSAMNSTGVIHYKIFVGSCTSEIFAAFIIELDEIMCSEL